MPSIRQITEQLDQVKALKSITGVYSEISALKINNIRSAFEQNAIYYEEISQIYQLVKRIAIYHRRELAANKLIAKKSNKVLYIAMTSNHGFYGSLNSDTIDQMAKASMHTTADRMVIGSIGIAYAKSTNQLTPFESVTFVKDE